MADGVSRCQVKIKPSSVPHMGGEGGRSASAHGVPRLVPALRLWASPVRGTRNIAMSVRVERPSECVNGGPPMNKATLNRTTLNSLATCAALALALATVPATAQEAGRTRVGTLTCNISPGVGMIVA